MSYYQERKILFFIDFLSLYSKLHYKFPKLQRNIPSIFNLWYNFNIHFFSKLLLKWIVKLPYIHSFFPKCSRRFAKVQRAFFYAWFTTHQPWYDFSVLRNFYIFSKNLTYFHYKIPYLYTILLSGDLKKQNVGHHLPSTSHHLNSAFRSSP